LESQQKRRDQDQGRRKKNFDSSTIKYQSAHSSTAAPKPYQRIVWKPAK